MLLIIGACALVLLIAGGAAVSRYLNSTAFREMLLERLNAQIDGHLAVGGHRFSLLAGKAAVSGVVFSLDGVRLATVTRLGVNISWSALMRRQVRITRMNIEISDLSLAMDDQDRLLLARAASTTGRRSASGTAVSPWALRVDDVNLEVGVLRFIRPSNQESATAIRVVASGRGDTKEPTGRLELAVEGLSWQRGDGPGQHVKKMVVVADYDPGRSRPVAFDVRVQESTLSIEGVVHRGARVPEMDLSYSIDLDLSLARAVFPLMPHLAGQAKAKGRVQGLADDPRATLRLDIADGRLGDLSVDRLGLHASLDRRKITVTDMQARSVLGDVDLGGTIDLQPMFARNWRTVSAGPESLVYDVDLKGRRLQPDQWSGLRFPLAGGQWQVQAQASGRGVTGAGISGSAEIAIQSDGVQVTPGAQPIQGDLKARLSWKDRVLQVRNLTAGAGPNRLDARGQIDMAARQMDLQGKADLGRLDILGTLLGLDALRGRAVLSLNGRGALASPTLQASLLAEEAAWAGWTLGRILTQARLDTGGVLTFSDLIIENQGSLIQGKGVLELKDKAGKWQPDPTIGFDLAFEQAEARDFYDADLFQGHLNGRLDISGQLKHPRADLDLDPSPLGWKGVDALAQGKARWDDGRLTVSNLTLSKDQSSLDLDGRISWRHPKTNAWTADPEMSVRLDSRILELNHLRKDWSGIVALEAQVDGPASGLRGSFSLAAKAPDFGLQRFETFRAKGRLQDRRLHIDEVAAGVADGQTIRADGWYDFDRQYALTLKGDGIDLAHIGALQKAYPVGGRMNLWLQGSGSLSQPGLNGLLEVSKPQFKDQVLDDFRVEMRLREERLDLDADLNFGLKGHANLTSGDYNLEAVFRRTDLAPYLALAVGSGWSGHLSGNLKAAGNWRAPLQTRMNTSFTDLQVAYGQVPLVSAVRLDIGLQDGRVDMPITHIQVMQDGHLLLQAAGPLRGALTARADGRLPLAALAPFTDRLTDAEGQIEIRARAKGPLAKPTWSADVDLAGLGMTLPGLSQTIEDVNGHIAVDSQSLVVDGLAGRVEDGRFSLNGRIGLAGMQPVEGRLDLNARRLPLQWPGTMDLLVNGDLRLDGKPEKATLAGRLDLIEGTYYKDVRLNLFSAIAGSGRRRPVPVKAKPSPWMAAVDLDVVVGYRNPLLVDNNLANLQVVPNLRLRGTLARPILNGRAEVTAGEVIYRRKSFDVKRGVVDFVNPARTEPTLDIVSEAQIRKWLVSLAVTGTPDQLQLKLSSDPPEEDNDILSLILLGRTSTELREGEGGENQTTAQMLASLVATAWGEDVRRTTGMDILELETGAQDEGDSQDRTQVTVGKKLSRRLTLKYAVESNHGDMIQKAISEYRFLEHLLVSGFRDSRGDYGGELLFRIEFQ